MSEKPIYNPNIHHRRSIRLKGYDYSQAGLYFMMVCCQDKISLFGHVQNGEMQLNEYGRMAIDKWVNTVRLRSNVKLGEFIIIPNRMHGTIQLSSGLGELHSLSVELETGEFNSPQLVSEFCSPSQTIGAIFRDNKSSVTKKLGFNEKLCQRNYFEIIIRTELSHERISRYILNNPAKWGGDKFYRR